MKKLAFTLLLAASFIIYACKKEKQEPAPPFQPIDYTVLPPETQTGANTFGCKVNGEVWVPRVPVLAVTYRDISSSLHEKDGNGYGFIECNLVDIENNIDNWLFITFGKTDYRAKQNCYENDHTVRIRFKKSNGEEYLSNYSNDNNNCVIITKLDTVNNIISGIFNFIAYNDTINKNDKIVITDGRFDLKYTPQ